MKAHGLPQQELDLEHFIKNVLILPPKPSADYIFGVLRMGMCARKEGSDEQQSHSPAGYHRDADAEAE